MRVMQSQGSLSRESKLEREVACRDCSAAIARRGSLWKGLGKEAVDFALDRMPRGTKRNGPADILIVAQ